MNKLRSLILGLPATLAGKLIFDLNHAMRENKRLEVLDPIPQSSPYHPPPPELRAVPVQ